MPAKPSHVPGAILRALYCGPHAGLPAGSLAVHVGASDTTARRHLVTLEGGRYVRRQEALPGDPHARTGETLYQLTALGDKAARKLCAAARAAS